MTSTLITHGTLTKNAGSDYTTQGNMPVEESKLMTIDMENAAFIMESLTNLYGDPHRSVAREYIANAIDSHIDAGNPDPVEVTTPSQWSPSLVVQDWGVGLSRDEVFGYGTYGSSTKRDNLKVVGNFGMGSKSALSITNTFTVEAVKDGWKTVATIGRNDDGHGEVNILSHGDTDERNGVKITIPIPAGRALVTGQNVEDVVKYLPAGRVSVDGKVNTDIRKNYTKLADDIHYGDLGWGDNYVDYDNVFIVTGGFSYPVPRDVMNQAFKEAGKPTLHPRMTIIDVPTGSVDLTPSRESLRMTARTKKLVLDGLTDVYREVFRVEQKKIQGFTTYDEFFEFTRTLSNNRMYVVEQLLGMTKNLYYDASDNKVTLKRVTMGTQPGSSRLGGTSMYQLVADCLPGQQDTDHILLEEDKEYTPRSMISRIKKYVMEVAPDTYNRRTVAIVLDPSYKKPRGSYTDTLYDYIKRTFTPHKISDIYAAVNQYNKDNRASSAGAGATGRGDNAKINVGIFYDDPIEYESTAFTSGTMADEAKEHFKDIGDYTVVLGAPKSSDYETSMWRLNEVLPVLRALGISPGNLVVINPSNRKVNYFTDRGVDLITAEDFYRELITKVTEKSAKAEITKYGAPRYDSLKSYWTGTHLDSLAKYLPKKAQVLSDIRSALTADSVTVGGEKYDGPEFRRLLRSTLTYLRSLPLVIPHGPKDQTLTHLLSILSGKRYSSLEIDALINGSVALYKVGRIDEACAMLDVILDVLTNKEEE